MLQNSLYKQHFIVYTISWINPTKLEIKSSDLPKILPEVSLNDHKLDSIIESVYQTAVNKIRPLKSNLNNFSRKSKTLLRYWKKLKLNDKGILIKVLSKRKHIVLPPNYHHIYRIVSKMRHLGLERAFDLVKRRFFDQIMKKTFLTLLKRNIVVQT